MNIQNPAVDDFISNAKKWKNELSILRKIILDCSLTEELKWKQPCYTYKSNNILLLACFKDYFAISFFKGVLLYDEQKLLVSPGENSQSMRYLKFTNENEIEPLKKTINAYIYEAIEIEIAGIKIDKTQSTEFELAEELSLKITSSVAFKKAFEALTIGRQRAYNMHISSAKLASTRQARVEQYTQRILSGKGLHDCTCGLSKKMPSCDGSHKFLVKK